MIVSSHQDIDSHSNDCTVCQIEEGLVVIYPFHRQCGMICHLIYMHSYCALPNQSPPTPCVLSHFGNLSVEHTRIATHRIEHNIPQNTFHLIQGWTTLDTCIYEYMSQHANPDVPIVPVLFKESNMIVCVLLVSNSLGCCLARGETSGVVSPRRTITRAQTDNTRRVSILLAGYSTSTRADVFICVLMGTLYFLQHEPIH